MGDERDVSTAAPSNTVTVFLRLRPVPNRSHHVHVDNHDGTICFKIPRDEAAGLINNQREQYSFLFNGILADDCSQEEVFERVCHASLSDFMAGINATVFAYGQTGSGKTFTITGGPERYADRGLIPRAISKVFDSMAQDSQQLYTLHISYMEIYNHTAFDLLDPSREIKELSDLPPVTILEDEDGKYHMRGLSLNRADTAEEALNLLFLGDTNRMIAETPMNMASSRSHCVLTMHLEARRPGDSVVRRSKLHLVDLAGSERVGRTGIDGTILTEAKYINSSLHFLEQVIIALQERSMGILRPHVPYRNSLMTMVLRDSLGGNCKTSMIANISTAHAFIDESISTCRFAQRVAMVSNTATVNEETDPVLVIKALRLQVRDLKDQIKLLQGGEEMRGPITQSERESLAKQVENYVNDPSPEARLDFGASVMSITAAFQAFKELCHHTGASNTPAQAGPASTSLSSAHQNTPSSSVQLQADGRGLNPTGRGSSGAEVPPNKGVQALQEENTKLRLQVQQRDNELSILVSMLKKREAVIQAAANTATFPSPSSSENPAKHHQGSSDDQRNSTAGAPVRETPTEGNGQAGEHKEEAKEPEDEQAVLFDLNSLADRNRAFELFRKSYRRNEAIENSKLELKGHYSTAKALAAEASSVKGKVQAAKADLEHRRLRRSAADIAAGGDGTSKHRDPSRDSELAAELSEDSRMAEEIRLKTIQYKKAFDGLRESKQVIEALHARLDHSRKQMAKDFVNWYQKMAQLFPNGQPTGATAAVVHQGVLPSGSTTSGPGVSFATDVLRINGTAQLQHRTSPAGTPHRSTPPLAAVPEHHVAPDEGPISRTTSTGAMVLARSAAQISTSEARSIQNTTQVAAVPSSFHNQKSLSGPIAAPQRALGATSSSGHVYEAQKASQQPPQSQDAVSSSGTAQQPHMGTISLSTGRYTVPHSASTAISLSHTVGTAGSSAGMEVPSNVNAAPSQSLRSGGTTATAKSVGSGTTNGGSYPPEVLEAAKPYLTGDSMADEDILGFYMARHSMIHGGG